MTRSLPALLLVLVLTFHVAEGEARAADLSDGQEVATVQGDPVTVRVHGETVSIDDATGT